MRFEVQDRVFLMRYEILGGMRIFEAEGRDSIKE
jgi:hypothetical protein